jgi:hypothetical protein
MKKITVREYANLCNITVQAAHKRIDNIKNYPEIKGIEIITKKLFLIKININEGVTNKFKKNAKII